MELDKTTEHYNDRGTHLTSLAPAELLGVKFLRIREDAHVPERGTELSAGYDLRCVEDVVLCADQTVKIPLGFATEMPPHIHGRIESRSGLALKGLVVLTGVIDADYRGEWNVIMRYLPSGTGTTFKFAKGDKVAQCVFKPTVPVAFEEVSELSDTARGAGGFGSTGS